MHNRVRMITASFLVKNLLVHWHHGAAWFWDCLLDADLASNSASWQWVAGSGTDASPFFRIFNPVSQGLKFDPDGSYTKRYIPELNRLPVKYLFSPWKAPRKTLEQAGVRLGEQYPFPIVDLQQSRKKALDSLKRLP
jgi:deoxyribodipyrimidine photo-lyase